MAVNLLTPAVPTKPAAPIRAPEPPPLEAGDRLTRAEFHRRYLAHPEIGRAELIEGVMYMPSPVKHRRHGMPHLRMSGWVSTYMAATPNLDGSDNTTVLLDIKSALDKSTIIDIMSSMQVDPVLFAKALADETRQEIMHQLCCVWLNVNDLVERLDGRVNQPTVSHHLKKLEEAGLVAVRQEGRYRYYSLNQEFLTVCCGALVTNFAPDYRSNTIPVDAIKVAGIDRGFDG